MVMTAFTCPKCSRIFLDRGPVPRHKDYLIGKHCPGSGKAVTNLIDLERLVRQLQRRSRGRRPPRKQA
ncbi:MAG TPA: hypothetical protein VI796_06820 [Candidatus Thermoplasmatota archaeon]|nr:hypothetical protein [Candidatus Thermoplasmatota archaeon]